MTDKILAKIRRAIATDNIGDFAAAFSAHRYAPDPDELLRQIRSVVREGIEEHIRARRFDHFIRLLRVLHLSYSTELMGAVEPKHITAVVRQLPAADRKSLGNRPWPDLAVDLGWVTENGTSELTDAFTSAYLGLAPCDRQAVMEYIRKEEEAGMMPEYIVRIFNRLPPRNGPATPSRHAAALGHG